MASPTTQPGIIRFGPFALDPTSRELRKRGHLIRLQPQQIAVLLLLTERAGQLVSREEIHQHIWGNDTFVDFERGINFSINQIRAALGDDADKPRYVETIPRRGYRFICPLEATGQAIDPTNGQAQEDAPSSAKPMEHLVSRAEPPGLPVMTNTATATASDAGNHQTAHGTRWKSTKWLLSGLALATLLIVTALLLVGTLGGRHLRLPWLAKAKAVAGSGRTIPLTNSRGIAVQPVFSPDGKQFAFLWNGKDQRKLDVYVQFVEGEEPLRLTSSGIRQICCIDWSPDGQWISFVGCDHGVGGIFKVPVLGGAEHKVTDVTCMELEFGSPQWTTRWQVHAAGGPLRAQWAIRDYGVFLRHRSEALPDHSAHQHTRLNMWNLSPDGRTVAFIRSTTFGVGDIYVVPLQGGVHNS